jgi:hypothetical protein
MTVFWVVASCSLVEVFITLMMEAVITSETLVNFYQTTRRNNPEGSHLHSRRRDNLKSYISYLFVFFALSVGSNGFIFRYQLNDKKLN